MPNKKEQGDALYEITESDIKFLNSLKEKVASFNETSNRYLPIQLTDGAVFENLLQLYKSLYELWTMDCFSFLLEQLLNSFQMYFFPLETDENKTDEEKEERFREINYSYASDHMYNATLCIRELFNLQKGIEQVEQTKRRDSSIA